MSELLKILQKEQISKTILDQVKQNAQKEVESKKQEFDQKLSQASLLNDEDKSKVFEYKKQAIESIRKEQKQELTMKLARLERKKNENMDEAVAVVINKLLR